MSVAVIIVAAGTGTRLGAGMPKALVEVAGRTILEHSLTTALAVRDLGEVVVVAPGSHLDAVSELVDRQRPAVPVTVVAGGADRTASVASGLAALGDALERDDAAPAEPEQVVLVHDAARCFTPVEVFDRVADAVRDGWVAVVPGLPVVDTVKVVDARGVVQSTPAREALRAVQTPQGFLRSELEAAHAGGTSATDDAALLEALGHRVLVVDGDPAAFKVTLPADLDRAHRHHADLVRTPQETV
ncbi:2-C-methyl-D-erythritol 4-phosphate cytidylyltransferase [Arsenicicoccus sp. oral taxon 190]|uniref:2-C-methyl-D-erythritol 4-phosphate cytidylyltransferase n=1 Tax=Arsenicicoccus sp. oral taxon 190 TaxID=1658671 RepID=UPI0020A09F21|nr:2-C-methyl-D-erythritol 4-phosphate cytidylyltransferase [Arsenicicoccus sp. oral taxon 190]